MGNGWNRKHEGGKTSCWLRAYISCNWVTLTMVMHYLWIWSTWAEYKLLNKSWKSKTNYTYYIYDFSFWAVRIWCTGFHTNNDHVNVLCTANLYFDSLVRTVIWGWQLGNDSGLIWDLTGIHVNWHVHLSTALATARVRRRKRCADGLHQCGGFSHSSSQSWKTIEI